MLYRHTAPRSDRFRRPSRPAARRRPGAAPRVEALDRRELLSFTVPSVLSAPTPQGQLQVNSVAVDPLGNTVIAGAVTGRVDLDAIHTITGNGQRDTSSPGIRPRARWTGPAASAATS